MALDIIPGQQLTAPISLPPYADQAAMLADQVNQIAGFLYNDGTSTWAKLTTSTGLIADYVKVGDQATIAGTLTDGHVATIVAGVPTWTAPSAGGGNFIAYDVAQALTGSERLQANSNIGSTSGESEVFNNSGVVTLNNLVVTKSNLIFTGASTVTLNGIVPLWEGQEITIQNRTGNILTIAGESSGSTETNRIYGRRVLQNFQSVRLKYMNIESVILRWVVVSTPFYNNQYTSTSVRTDEFLGVGRNGTANVFLTLRNAPSGYGLYIRNIADNADVLYTTDNGIFLAASRSISINGAGLQPTLGFHAKPLTSDANYCFTASNIAGTAIFSVKGDGLLTSKEGFFYGAGGAFTSRDANTRGQIRGIGTTTNVTLLLEDSAGTDNVQFIDNGQIRFFRLPTSSAGLASGSLWNDLGTLKIV